MLDAYILLLKKISAENLLKNALKKFSVGKRNVNVVSIGKAAIPMLNAFSNFCSIDRGLVISPFFKEIESKQVDICVSTHPNISEKSLICADKLVLFLEKSEKFTVFLLSGGGSALVEKPLDFLELSDVSGASKFLVNSGLPIWDINFFRIHLSKIKGGGLLNFLKTDAVCFVLSDVLNNRVDRVSSAPLIKIDRDYRLFVKKGDDIGLWSVLGREKRDLFLKSKFLITDKKIKHIVVGSNDTVVDKFSSILEKRGLTVKRYYNFVYENVEKEAENILKVILKKSADAFVFGGEATVNVKGNGVGGRTFELGLRLLKLIKEKGIEINGEILFATTDGMDGNSNSAGFFLSGDNLKNILKNETVKAMESYLEKSDTFSFFKKHNCTIHTGYTGNNLLDIYAVRLFN